MGIESELVTIEDFVRKGNFHAAINISISALNECRRNNDQSGVDRFLDEIKSIHQKMVDEFGSKV